MSISVTTHSETNSVLPVPDAPILVNPARQMSKTARSPPQLLLQNWLKSFPLF